ncbi:transglycosylase SLT domain-containing protein, partial [Thiolapillus sp.]|uniref:transglycosylase SLT domain-containing protein n=1 Tax=Thiolapillus sp. TaxID=2017437 RepID=UPI003AF51900
MQIMPSTFKEIREKNPTVMNLEDPKWNIAAGIFYDRYLYDKWEFLDTDERQRLFFAFGSYQACLRPRERFWDIPVPKIDSAFDNLFVPQPSWSPSTTQQL